MDDDAPPDEDGDGEPTGPRTALPLAVLVEGGLLVLALLLGWLLGQPALGTFAWDYRAALWGLVGTVPMVLLFGLMHFVTRTYALLAALMGAYLGLVWYWTGNLLTVVLMHALYDFLVLLYLLRGPGSGEEEPGEPAA